MTEAEWLVCNDPEAMLAFVKDTTTDRKLRLFGVACCRRIWSLMPNKKCKSAVDAAEGYSDGRYDSEQLQAASEKIAVSMLALRSECAEYAASAAAWVSSRDNLERVAEAAAAAHDVKISIDDWAIEKRIEQGQQAVILRDIVDNPLRPVLVSPSWLTSTVLALARGIYDEKAFDRMPILADALQDTGCANEDVLNHCRDTSQVHARGCWVVDLVLGKE